jgi:hypothetical protein
MALPNLRRLFVEARTEAEENEYSRNAVRDAHHGTQRRNLLISVVLQFGPLHFISGCIQPRGATYERQQGHEVKSMGFCHAFRKSYRTTCPDWPQTQGGVSSEGTLISSRNILWKTAILIGFFPIATQEIVILRPSH